METEKPITKTTSINVVPILRIAKNKLSPKGLRKDPSPPAQKWGRRGPQVGTLHTLADFSMYWLVLLNFFFFF